MDSRDPLHTLVSPVHPVSLAPLLSPILSGPPGPPVAEGDGTAGADPGAIEGGSFPPRDDLMPPPPAEPPPARPGHDTSSGDYAYSRQGLFKRVINDQGYLVTKWWPNDFKNPWFTVPLAVGVAAAVQGAEGNGVDQSVANQVHSDVPSGNTARGFSILGNAATGALLIGSLYFIGRATGNNRLRETGSLSAEALLDAGIWVTALKAITARTRPSAGGVGDFFQYSPSGDQSNGSFPSGHAIGSFTVATVIAREYADTHWVPWVAYGAASLISLSRVVQGRHFPSDVLVGGILGNSIGRMVIYRAHGDEPRMLGEIHPIVSSSGQGVGVAWSYDWSRHHAVRTCAEAVPRP